MKWVCVSLFLCVSVTTCHFLFDDSILCVKFQMIERVAFQSWVDFKWFSWEFQIYMLNPMNRVEYSLDWKFRQQNFFHKLCIIHLQWLAKLSKHLFTSHCTQHLLISFAKRTQPVNSDRKCSNVLILSDRIVLFNFSSSVQIWLFWTQIINNNPYPCDYISFTRDFLRTI